MGEGVSVAALWGRIALHNKLLNQQQWEECVEVYRKAGGKTPIEKILVHKGFLQEPHAEAIRRKIDDILEKQGVGTRGAGSPGVAGSPGIGARPLLGNRRGPVVRHAPVRPGATPPGIPGKANGQVHLEPIPLFDIEGGEDSTKGSGPVNGRRADAVPKGDPQTADPNSMDPIPLVSDEEMAAAHPAAPVDPGAPPAADAGTVAQAFTPAKSKIVKKEHQWFSGAQNVAPRAAATPLPASGPLRKPAADAGHDAESLLLESGVEPLDFDTDAIEILYKGVAMGASGVHLSAGSPAFYRLHGQLVFTETPGLTRERARRIVLGFMDETQQRHFLTHHDVGFVFAHPDLGRSRVHALQQFRGPGIVFRPIPDKAATLEELGLPAALGKLTECRQGLVLVTGPGGSGKSTTAAALLDLINRTRQGHIITVEGPVEVVHLSQGCTVTQRQVSRDTQSFATALRGALREDPDVVMVAEMGDPETVWLAIQAAEAGHLVLGILPARSVPGAIHRLVSVFPGDQQARARAMLAESLRGVTCQRLIPRADGNGRTAGVEVLFCDGAVGQLIRDAKTFQIVSQIPMPSTVD